MPGCENDNSFADNSDLTNPVPETILKKGEELTYFDYCFFLMNKSPTSPTTPMTTIPGSPGVWVVMGGACMVLTGPGAGVPDILPLNRDNTFFKEVKKCMNGLLSYRIMSPGNISGNNYNTPYNQTH